MGHVEKRSWLLGILFSILLIPVSVYAQTQRTVTGAVIDETREPLIGATVKVVGELIGATTDLEGHYLLKVPTTAKQLAFSYVGYNNLVVDITSDVIDVTVRCQTKVHNSKYSYLL